jgi:hypothetical protein
MALPIKNPALKRKVLARKNRGDRSGTYLFGLISILILIASLLQWQYNRISLLVPLWIPLSFIKQRLKQKLVGWNKR